MYKCPDCGHLFEEGEQSTWTECHGESSSGCPVCSCEALVEAKRCKVCGEWMMDDWEYDTELYSGICEGCLKDYVSEEYALQFLCETEDLVFFVFNFLLGAKVRIEEESEALRIHARETFMRKILNDKLIGKFANVRTLNDAFVAYLEKTGVLTNEWAEFVQEKIKEEVKSDENSNVKSE